MIESTVEIQATGLRLQGNLTLPDAAHGIIIFAHGSGSSRHSPRNRAVAQGLNRAGFATLLIDLLTVEEEADRRNVFDIPMLADRVIIAAHWVRQRPDIGHLPIGLFGASTGAAAALVAASKLPSLVKAVVSRGGRPDLAGDALHFVAAPTLLLVGSRDHQVILLNQQAAEKLDTIRALVIVPGAGHLFEEAGTLELVVEDAIRWFAAYLKSDAPVS